jgi:alanine racemase
VTDLSFAKVLNAYARRKQRRTPIHVKIDTGMGRLGVWHEKAESFIDTVLGFDNLTLEGLFTHFPAADTDRDFTRHQIALFNRLIADVRKKKVAVRYFHCANSIGMLSFKEAHFNLVRPGLILYGIASSLIPIKVQPLLSLKSKVIFVKRLARGRSVSYGRTFIAGRDTNIATVSIGYADGYPWTLSNKASTIIRSHIYPIAGRVCMDYIMVDVGDSRIKPEDTVTLIGKDKTARIGVQDLARWAGTIPYEIVSRLSLKIPRCYRYSTDENNSAYSHRKKGDRRNPAG